LIDAVLSVEHDLIARLDVFDVIKQLLDLRGIDVALIYRKDM